MVAPSNRISTQAQRTERRAEALRMHIAGHTWQKIADRLGYSSAGHACADGRRALEILRAHQDQAAEEYRAIELARLDEALAVAMRIMAEEQVAHSNGKIVYRQIEGQQVPVVDNTVALAAADRVVKISESRRKLLGLDAPVRQEVTGTSTVHYMVSGVSADELEAL
jgi:hypothetical protein